MLPAVLQGEFRLVLISGNAGDGKTAFLQRLEKEVEARGGSVNRGLANGSELSLDGKRYLMLQPEDSADGGAWRLRGTLVPPAGAAIETVQLGAQ